MKGSLRQRGKQSWQLRYFAGNDPSTGKDVYRAVTFKGSKREAQIELSRRVAAFADGKDVATGRARLTFNQFLDEWESWIKGQTRRKTFARYKQLLDHNIRPRFGGYLLADLEKASKEVELHYVALIREPRTFTHERLGKTITHKRRPLNPQTVKHVHRVLHGALSRAVAWRQLAANPLAAIKPPAVPKKEMVIWQSDQVGPALRKLAADPLYPLIVTALGSGCRRGELLGMTWGEVLIGERGGSLRVERSIEEVDEDLAVNAPKSENSRRTVAIDAYTAAVLRAHRVALAQQRLALGLGGIDSAALVFPAATGTLQKPDSVSRQWSVTRRVLKLPPCTLHGLRHTHASICIAKGMNVHTLSRRLGHHSAAFTLKVYGHLFDAGDDSGATIMGALFAETAPALTG